MTPMLHLAAILHSIGFSISFIHTKFNAPNSSKYPQFTFHPLSDHLSESETAVFGAFPRFIDSVLHRFLRESSLRSDFRFCPNFHQRHRQELRPAEICAQNLRRGAFLVYSSFPLLQEKHYLPIQASQLEQSVVYLPPLRVKDLPAIGVPDMETFTKYISELVEEAKTSSGVIFNSFEELEDSAMAVLRQTFLVPIYPIGPFHLYSPPNSSSYLTPDRTSISWLDKQAPKSVIYVTFGSAASLKQRKCLEIAWGLANSGFHFLWVIRPGSISGMNRQDALPEQFMDMVEGRGYIGEWAPQLDVLAHPAIGAFWTHCGWNSTLESICEGVPMICTPIAPMPRKLLT
ncbi:UDP-glycosyltransferase 76F2-like [Andrographis paniculata]|uniref:UDP-glycosyltransferase 76F2-like n=1 Tax=Andrographis paniculata TaxID=175694 RepID=UPI0021E72784|nr:UDP-glycosyltransferase 76F2-like [Andrographis paniculata]